LLERVPIVVSALVAAAGLAVGIPVVAAAANAATTAAAAGTTVFVAPAAKGGSDVHTGLSSSSPVLTLARVGKVLEAARPAGDVTVSIQPGSYTVGQTDWTFYVPGHTISFLPAGFVPGHGRPASVPVFTDTMSGSTHAAAWWFHALEPRAGTAPLHNGGTAGLRFYYLRVQDYTGGISFDGQTGHASRDHQNPPMYVKPSAGVNGNTVFGMTFANIGDRYAGGTGFGAILFTDSSANLIQNNTFDHVENVGSTTGLIHGLYITHFSASNRVLANRFTTISSDAVKVRDRSNVNDVEHNTFNATGGTSAYRDEFCDLACVQAHPGTPRQCASYDNRFFNNTVGAVYGGTRKLPAWSLNPPGLTNAGGAGCSIPSGKQRLRTGGNT
jgi:hypothetical protein